MLSASLIVCCGPFNVRLAAEKGPGTDGAQKARRWRKLPRLPTGGTIAFAGLSAARYEEGRAEGRVEQERSGGEDRPDRQLVHVPIRSRLERGGFCRSSHCRDLAYSNDSRTIDETLRQGAELRESAWPIMV